MAVGLFRYDRDIHDDNAKLTLSENISSQVFYEKHWERAIEQLGIKYIKDCGEFDKLRLDIVLEELNLLKKWTEQNLVNQELEYMMSRVENLEKVIPTAFIDDSTLLYTFFRLCCWYTYGENFYGKHINRILIQIRLEKCINTY